MRVVHCSASCLPCGFLVPCCLRLCIHCVLQVAARPADVEALRLLGESRLLNAEPAKSVSAYEKAIALAPDDQSIITVSPTAGPGAG